MHNCNRMVLTSSHLLGTTTTSSGKQKYELQLLCRRATTQDSRTQDSREDSELAIHYSHLPSYGSLSGNTFFFIPFSQVTLFIICTSCTRILRTLYNLYTILRIIPPCSRIFAASCIYQLIIWMRFLQYTCFYCIQILSTFINWYPTISKRKVLNIATITLQVSILLKIALHHGNSIQILTPLLLFLILPIN